MSMKDEWRSVTWKDGGQCAMITGMTLMHWWRADSLEYLLVICPVIDVMNQIVFKVLGDAHFIAQLGLQMQ